MIFPEGTLLMNGSRQLGMIVEIKQRPLFSNEYEYHVEWYIPSKDDGETNIFLSFCGPSVIERYVEILQNYKYANRIVG